MSNGPDTGINSGGRRIKKNDNLLLEEAGIVVVPQFAGGRSVLLAEWTRPSPDRRCPPSQPPRQRTGSPEKSQNRDQNTVGL